MAYQNSDIVFKMIQDSDTSVENMMASSDLSDSYYNKTVDLLGLRYGPTNVNQPYRSSRIALTFPIDKGVSHYQDNFKFLNTLGKDNLAIVETLKGSRGSDKPPGLFLLQRFEGTQEWDALPRDIKFKLNDFINHVELVSGIMDVRRLDKENLKNYIDQNVATNISTGQKFSYPKDRPLPKSKDDSFAKMATKAGDNEAIEWVNKFIKDLSKE